MFTVLPHSIYSGSINKPCKQTISSIKTEISTATNRQPSYVCSKLLSTLSYLIIVDPLLICPFVFGVTERHPLHVREVIK